MLTLPHLPQTFPFSFHPSRHLFYARTQLLWVILWGTLSLHAQTTPTTTTSTPTYRLVWQDDFNGDTLNTQLWSPIARVSSTVAWNKYMSNHPSLYKQKGGRLRLYGRRNDGLVPNDTATYLTAGISSQNKRTFTYGKLEIRARIKGVKGCWPAIWIKNNDRNTESYKHQAEIDVIEYYNTDDHVVCTIHNTYTMQRKFPQRIANSAQAPIRKNRYNIYTMEILPDSLVWSVNGAVKFTYPRLPEEGFPQFPFGSSPLYLMLDMQIGNPWLREIDDTNLPAYMDIDWVKCYELAK